MDYDSPWKEAVERYFNAFMQLFFSDIHAEIDWNKGYEFLDKELEKIVRDAERGRRIADKLVKVYLYDGKETWFLIHIEIQGYSDKKFSYRMYVYNYRLSDKYKADIVSLAVLTDDNPDYRPGAYIKERFGCSLMFEFPAVKVLDFGKKWKSLEKNPNPFSLVVMAHLKAQELGKGKEEERKQWKLYLTRMLYERGYSRKDILELFRFIDWLIILPQNLEDDFWKEIKQTEEKDNLREQNKMPVIFTDGNEAVVRGAVYAGCRFFAGYPITPATSIFTNMLKFLPPLGGICLQGEDEIASIGYCLGASMAGMKVMTATSGPGISLYSEHISFAIGSEIPIVIIDVQRLGPSTGSATRGADGDIQFLRWGNSGGLPVIVLSPTDVRDCFILTIQAFNLAEEYRCPVFIASNKEVALTRESIDLKEEERIEINNRIPPPAGSSLRLEPTEHLRLEPTEHFFPFDTSPDLHVPYFLPIGGDIPVRQTSSTHGKDGYITADPAEIGAIRNRLKQKLLMNISRFSFYEEHTAENADTLVITYGVTARAAKELFNREKSFSLLILKTLYPVPEALIQEKSQNMKRIIVIEMNLGQYIREIERILPDKRTDFLGQMDGRLITPNQIKEIIKHE